MVLLLQLESPRFTMDKYEGTHSGHPKNIKTPSGFEILWDEVRTGYILPGYGKLRVAKDVARRFAMDLERKYGEA